MYNAYIIYNSSHDKFYIGQSSNLEKRLREHNEGLSTYTSKYSRQWELKYYEPFSTRREAVKREGFLKKQKNKEFYWKLINNRPAG